MTQQPLKQLGKYQLVDVLGEGAMGVVYRAFDQVLNRYLAIKVMSSAIGNNAQLRERFLREARAAGSLQHPNVVTVYDFGEIDDHLFIAMEFVDGEDLAEIIRRRQNIPIATKLDIIIDTLNGLAYAHNRQVVHRDIKPANIRVTTDTRAKLMDFGIAYLQKSELTQSGVLIGTPQYMAPEQVSGGAITAATDVFAAGAVLFEFLSYQKPFEGETLHIILYNIMSVDPPAISSLVPKAPAALDDIVAKALAKDPADRYESAVGMSKALSAARQALSPAPDAATITLRRSGGPGAPPTMMRTSQIQGMIAAEVAKRQRRGTWIAGGVATVALAATIWFAPWVRDDGGTDLPGESATAPSPGGPPSATGAARPDSVVTAGPETTSKAAPPTGGSGRVGGDGRASGTSRGTTPARQGVPPANARGAVAAAPADTALLRSMRLTAMSTRLSALDQGATTADLARGDSVLAMADAAFTRGRGTEASTHLAAASALWNDAARTARARATAERQAAATPPITALPPPVRPETMPRPPPDPRPDIERVIAVYATAIQSRSVDSIRRAYPGLTVQQQQNWEGFYRIARNFRATLTITSLSFTGTTATASINTVYQFENTSNGREVHQPLPPQTATLARDGDTWRITSIR